MPIVTEQLLEQGISLNGAWNVAQLKALGVKFGGKHHFWPAGWKKKLLGSKVTQEQVNEFLSLKNRHLAHKSRDISEQQELWHETYSHMASIRQELKHSIA